MTGLTTPSRVQRTQLLQRLWRTRLRAPATADESLRIERVIAAGRLLLAVVAISQIGLIQPAWYAPTAHVLVICFAAHAVAAVAVLRTRRYGPRVFSLATSTIDLICVAGTLPITTPASWFFAFFFFVLAAAAFRWGLRETLATTAGAVGVVLLYAYVTSRASWPVAWTSTLPDVGLTTGRAAYLALIGLMLGYLAEEGRLVRAEAAAIARLLAHIRVDAGITRALTAVAKDLLKQFNATRLMLVIEELGTGRLYRWDTEGGWAVSPTGLPINPYSVDRLKYFFGPPNTSLAVVRRRWPWNLRGLHRTVALDGSGHVISPEAIRAGLPATFAAAHPFRRLINVPVTFGEEWSGRIFLFDPRVDVRTTPLARFLQGVVLQVSPAVFSVYLMSRLHARAGALERARVARELHDGVIQSMIGVEMQLQVLRGRDGVRGTGVDEDLTRLQYLVRNEVLSLRELMQQLRPVEFDPHELLDYLADLVQRFGRDSGISAQFLTELGDVQLPWRVCFELVKIVQESLVNVRKHSGASHVVVRLGARGGCWMLEVNDNGHGFPFEGRFTDADLDASHRGPTIIKERVKAIGGRLTIDSSPVQGVRLEVLIPEDRHG